MQRRFKLLRWGLKANLKLNLTSSVAQKTSFALVNDKPPGKREIQAMGFWHPPERVAINFPTKFMSGWLLAPLVFGAPTYRRLSEVLNAMEKTKQQVLGKNQEAWYLNNLAVAERLRGQGLGSQLLRQQLHSKVIPSEYPAILMTQKQSNVSFYQKLGFRIVAKTIVGSETNAFNNWCMLFE